jgi:hypothetical protein
MSEAARKATIDRLEAVVLNPAAKIRSVLAISKAMGAFARINVAALDLALRCRQQEELAAEVEQLKSWREACEGDAPKGTIGEGSS